MLRVALSVLPFDLRNVLRDDLLVLIVAMTGVFLGVVAWAGVNAEGLGIQSAQPFMQYVIIFALMSTPVNFGLIFGLMLIEEVETGARAALLTTPTSASLLALLRTPPAAFITFLMGMLYVAAINPPWNAAALSIWQWVALIAAAAALTPAIMISISTFASTRIEALALGKAYSAMTGPPILLYLAPPDAWWRALFLIFPTTPMIKAYDAFRADADLAALAWLGWGFVYVGALTWLALRRFVRLSYKLMS